MSRWTAYVTPQLPDYVMQDISAAFDTTFSPDGRKLTVAELLAVADGKDVLIGRVGDPMNAEFFSKVPKSIKAVGTYSVGFDHVDVAAAKAAGVPVFNTPEVLTDTVAECCMLLTLAVARRVTEDVQMMQGNWTGWTALQLVGLQLADRTMGIFGFGRIGRAIAQRARGFRMKIAYSDLNRLPAELEEGAAFYPTPEELMKNCDVFVLAANSTPQTRGLLNKARIALLKPDAIVVNIARGDLVVDGDLIEALQANKIFGAGLDVFNNEPNFDPRYKALPNAVILPHIGSSTREARRGMGGILIEGIQAFRDGRAARNRLA